MWTGQNTKNRCSLYITPTYSPFIIDYWCKSIYKFGLSVCLSVCLFVCLYPINVKTAEPIGPKFFVGHLGTPGKVYESSKFVSIKIRSSLNFLKFWKSAKFFVKIRELFLFCFTMYTKRTCSQLIEEMGAKRLEFLVYLYLKSVLLFRQITTF